MAGERSRRAVVFAAAVALASAALAGILLTGVSAARAAAFSCRMSGSVTGNNPAAAGDTEFASVTVSGSHCAATFVAIDLNGTSAADCPLSHGNGTCSRQFPVFVTTIVTARLSDGEKTELGTVTIAATHTPTPTRTVTVTVPRTSAPHTAATTAKATPSRSLTPAIGGLPGSGIGLDTPSDTPTDSPTPSDSSSASNSAAAVAFPVDTIHGNGSVSLIPTGLLAATVLVLGVVFCAAVRFVYVYYRTEDTASR